MWGRKNQVTQGLVRVVRHSDVVRRVTPHLKPVFCTGNRTFVVTNCNITDLRVIGFSESFLSLIELGVNSTIRNVIRYYRLMPPRSWGHCR